MIKKNTDSTSENNHNIVKSADKFNPVKSMQTTIPQIILAPSNHKTYNTPNIPPAPANLYRIQPKSMSFYGKNLYSQSMTIQNIGRDPLKLFLSTPKTIYFSLNESSKHIILSTGMTRKISIQLVKIPPDRHCLDYITIKSQHYSDKIQLSWSSAISSIEYEKLIDIGKVEVARNLSVSVSFNNTSSSVSRRVRLLKDPWDNIQLSVDELVLLPGKTMALELTMVPPAPGVYHHKLALEEEGVPLPPIEVIYAAMECFYRLEDSKGEPAKELDFGTLLRGTSKELQLWAHNSSPWQVELRSKVKIGKSLRAQSALQSPQQLGVESSSTVIDPLSKNIKVGPFEKVKVVLVASLKVEQKHKQMVERLARSDMLTQTLKLKLEQEDTEHQEILVCQFAENIQGGGRGPGKTSTYVVPMRVGFTLPALKVDPSALVLGSLTAMAPFHSSLALLNLGESPLTLTIGKLFNSECFPTSVELGEEEVKMVEIVTKSHNLGQFKGTFQILVASIYPIRVPIQYQVVAPLNDRTNTAISLNRSNNSSHLNRTGTPFLLNRTSPSSMSSYNYPDLARTMELAEQQDHRRRYGVPALRTQIKQKSSTSLVQPVPQTSSSIRNSSAARSRSSHGKQSQEDSCLPREPSPGSRFKKYPLFVTRKIDKYMPFDQLRESKKLQKSRNCRDHFAGQLRRQPKNRKEAEEIQRELAPEELKLISISSKVITFGRLFVKSQSEREWTIQNQTDASIIVQLRDNSSDPKKYPILASSDFEPQIIPVHCSGRFRIVLSATLCGRFESTLCYTINNLHSFQLLVSAEIELVTLTPSKPQLKLGYVDQQDLLLSDSLLLRNDGNTAARFVISQPSDKFSIVPSQGEVPANDTVQVTVTENDRHFPVIQAGEIGARGSKNSMPIQLDERILIKVADGNDISLRVTNQPGTTDPRCLIKEQKLQFGCTIVSKQKTKTFTLKNLTRTLALFQIINDQCSEFLTFDSLRGRVPPQGSRQVTVSYKSTVIHTLNAAFKVVIRGGLVINVPISAESIAPDVSILEPTFAFGQLCCDTAAIRPISIRNSSEIPVELFLDTRGRERGAEFLFPSFWGAHSTPLKEGTTPVRKILQSYGKGNNGVDEEIIDNASREPSIHRIKIQPKSVYSFNFVFKPSQAGYYEFLLPIFLQNFIRNDSLSKVVSCLAIEPRFVVQPAIIRFKKKIINDKDNGCFHPFVEYLTLRNPTDRLLRWKLDLGGPHKSGASFTSYSSASLFSRAPKEHLPKSCFEIQQKRGELKPKESVSINVSFNPIEEGCYYHKVPLFIFNEEKGTYQQEAELRLEGEGKYPSLQFNRRQLILPAVPLGIEAIGMFEVINEGYETISLKHRFQMCDSEGNPQISKGNFPGENGLPQLSLSFPEGCKLSVNKRSLIVMVKFMSRKPTSFTCKLQLYDDLTDCRVYALALSATADNSLLTSFAYLADPQNIYKLEQGPLQPDKRIKKLDDGATYTVNLKSNDGRHLIDRYHNRYDQMEPDSLAFDCMIAKRWMNHFFREQKVRNFPSDLAQNNELCMKLLHRLTARKEFQGSLEIDPELISKQPNAPPSKLPFYCTLIRLLKQLGCLLNHIRPEFLLERQEFLATLSQEPGWKSYGAYYLKNQQILHEESWLTLLYQLITQFWCQRLRFDPPHTKPASNLYSAPQLAVLRWAKLCYQTVNPLQDTKGRFLSFGHDYRDCIAPIHCLLRYVLPARRTKSIEGLTKHPVSPAEYASNLKILYQLLERLNIVPLVYEDEYQNCSDKEIFLLMYQLYQLLPQLLPKGPPLIFSCELGETVTQTIDIKNPSNKTVHYWIKVEGSRDFTAQERECISIEPKTSIPFVVNFKARLSLEQTAFLSFFSKQEGEPNSANGTAMVFELRSRITGRKSLKKLDMISCPLYDSTTVKVTVQNPFQDCQIANFNIKIFQELQSSYNLTNKTTQNSQDLNETGDSQLLQFHCQLESLKIKKGTSAFFQLHFSPVRLAKTKCLLVFHDPAAGEFQYQLPAFAQIPRPLQELKIQQSVWVGTRQWVQLLLPVYNNLMLKCEALLEQREQDRPRKNKQTVQQKFKFQLNMDPKITEHIIFPHQVFLKAGKKDNAEQQNKLRIQCNFLCVLKDLVLDFLLMGSPSKEVQDVRRFKVALTVQHRPLTQELIMTTPARKSIVQPIPIENLTNKDWKLRTSIMDNEWSCFSLKEGERTLIKEVVVRKGQTQQIPIYFEPKCIGRSNSKVIINNLTTNQQIILILKGVAEQPLSEDHIHIKANAEEPITHTLTITNPYPETLTYRVLSDIEELQLPLEVTLGPSESIPFYIYAVSAGGSSQVGYLKFIQSESARFFWYSVTLENAQKKTREFNVELITDVGTEIQKFVQFKNPFSKSLQFKVQYQKQIGLQAKEQFTVSPQGTYQFRIKYHPRRAVSQETVLKATNREVGIFLYKIKLIASEQIKRRMLQMTAEVGKSGSLEIRLDNSRKEPLKVNYTLSNVVSFSIEAPDILQPGQNVARIQFRPSSEGRENCSIRFWGEHFPTRCFQIEANGLAPYSIETIQFRTRHNQQSLEVIRFVNPNPKRCKETVRTVLSEDQHGCFCFAGMDKKREWLTEVEDLLPIPVLFLPKEKGYFQSVLTVQCFNYQWKYLLKGSTNFRQTQRIQEEIKTPNKVEVIRRLKIPVPDYYDLPPTHFDHVDFDHSDKNILKLLKQWLRVRLNHCLEDEPNEKVVTLLLKFKPKKIVNEVIRLVLSNSKQEGPTLICNLQLTVTESYPESIIELEIQAIKTLTFELNGLGPQATISAKMAKRHHCQAQRVGDAVRLKFKPTHLLFTRQRHYSDLLLLQNEQQQNTYEIRFTLKK